MKSEKFKLNYKDVLKGLLIAGGTSALFVIQDCMAAGQLQFEWKKMSMGAIGGMATYLIKNFFEGEKPTPTEAQS